MKFDCISLCPACEVPGIVECMSCGGYLVVESVAGIATADESTLLLEIGGSKYLVSQATAVEFRNEFDKGGGACAPPGSRTIP